MCTDFIIVKPGDDPVMRLRATFPDVWNELSECADPDTPYLMYFAFADLLLRRRENTDLWSRAYRFFDDIADGGDTAAHDVLSEAFDRLWDSDARNDVEARDGSAARTIFQRSKL